MDWNERVDGLCDVAMLTLEFGQWTVVHGHVRSDPLVFRYRLVIIRVENDAAAGQRAGFRLLLLLLLDNGLLRIVGCHLVHINNRPPLTLCRPSAINLKMNIIQTNLVGGL